MRTGGGGGFPGGPGGMPFGGGNPFGQFGAGNTGRNSRTGAGSLSVGVDEQSNSIVVSSSEATYQEVKKLVETLDLAASENQRTVQIVTVKNSSPTAVQDALNGLMGLNSRTNTQRTGGDFSGRNFGNGFSPFGAAPVGIQFGVPGGQPFGGGQFNGGFNRGGGNFGPSFDGGGRGNPFGGGGGGFNPFGGGGGNRRP